MTLGKKATRSAVWVLMGGYCNMIVALVGNIVLARLLLPEDFGIYAFSQSLFIFLFMFAGFGCQESIVQCRDREIKQLIPTAFWITLGIAFCITFAGMLLAYILGFYYGEQIRALLFLFSWMGFLRCLEGAYRHHLQRHLKFRIITLVEATATISSFLLGIGAAVYGLGLWSLAVREVAMAIFIFLGMILFSSFRWTFTFNRKAARWIFRFGSQTMISRITDVIFHYLDRLLIGSFLGAGSLGHYTLAYRLANTGEQLTQKPVNALIHSVFAFLQFEKEKLAYAFERTQYWLWRIVVALGAIVFLMGADLVELIYGQQWERAGEVFRMMAPFVIFLPLNGSFRSTLIAAGQIQSVLKTRFWQLLCFIPGVIAATLWGNLITVVLMINFCLLLSWLLMALFIKKTISVSWTYLALKPLCAAFIAFWGATLLLEFYSPSKLWALVLYKGSSLGILFLGVLLLLDWRSLIREVQLILHRIK